MTVLPSPPLGLAIAHDLDGAGLAESLHHVGQRPVLRGLEARRPEQADEVLLEALDAVDPSPQRQCWTIVPSRPRSVTVARRRSDTDSRSVGGARRRFESPVLGASVPVPGTRSDGEPPARVPARPAGAP